MTRDVTPQFVARKLLNACIDLHPPAEHLPYRGHPDPAHTITTGEKHSQSANLHQATISNLNNVTIRLFSVCHFLLVVLWNRASVSNGFRDICIQVCLGHELDYLLSRDVIGHVTIWFLRSHFL